MIPLTFNRCYDRFLAPRPLSQMRPLSQSLLAALAALARLARIRLLRALAGLLGLLLSLAVATSLSLLHVLALLTGLTGRCHFILYPNIFIQCESCQGGLRDPVPAARYF